jgi:VanZ family protein
MHKTSAWPLALVYCALVVYASLYPFSEWRDQGISGWVFLAAPLPKYWTGFDVTANVLGYAPLGFLLALSALRTGRSSPLLLAAVSSSLLSLVLEGLQSYLPSRVPSNVDWALNTGGALAGAVAAVGLERLGALDRWGRLRERWFVPQARGALVLLALWPLALLFPPSVALSLGQVLERVEMGLADALSDTPFLEWLPIREVEMQPLVPGVELLCVALGVLVPCLLGFSIIRSLPRRMVFIVLVFIAGIGATVLSATMSYGPGHGWAWLSLPVRAGLAAGLVLALLAVFVPRRGCAALALLGLVLHLSLLNQAPTSAYFAQTLQTWEQGRFIRFHGLAQWLGWLWPYATLVYVVLRLSRREPNA